jgi:AraC-like DNA-binding protein
MHNDISILFSGFSIFSCLILLFVYLFFLQGMQKTTASKFSCIILLACLTILQTLHYLYFTRGLDLLSLRSYVTILVIIPSSFFFFSREVLAPKVQYSKTDLLHIAPTLLSMFIPLEVLPAIAFLIGTTYTFWFARLVLKVKVQSARFKIEMFFFGLFAVMAFSALLLGLSLPYIDHDLYYSAYANAISLAMISVVAALLIFPELLSDIVAIAELSYSKSKLDGIDVGRKLSELERLMKVEKLFENEELTLLTMAEAVGISSHQLSELINTEFGYGFPRYIREYRIDESRRLLLDDTSVSILAVSLMTGFKSQSNFYTAFKQSTGESPGGYRTRLTDN